MITLKRILVATDFSEPAGVAVTYGRALARAYNATLHVIHVIENMPAFCGPEVGLALSDVDHNIEAAAQRDLEATIAARDDASLMVVAAVTRGASVAHAITEYAKAHAIDLIIAGTHGRGVVSRFLMGSVAERVVRSAPCPVLTVHAHHRHFVDVGHDCDRLTASPVEPPAANREMPGA